MEKIIDPVPVELIKAELTPDKKICNTNKGGNEVYTVTWHDAPNTVREIGRLREEAFRAEGGCSGLACDLDEFDTMEVPYHQMLVWDPDQEAILGGYRYILGPEIKFNEDGQPHLATAHMFRFSDDFITNYLPRTAELGRSFVSLGYQSSKSGAKAIYALDNLWDGLTAVLILHPQMVYLFGKMTMYPHLDKATHDLILHFLWKHYGDKDELVRPIEPIMPATDPRLLDMILTENDFKSDYRLLKEAVKKLGSKIPPLVNTYMSTSPSMLMFGTGPNHEFGEVDETAFLIDFDNMYSDKKDRHVESFLRQKFESIKKRFPRFEEPEIIASVWNKFRNTRNRVSNETLLEQNRHAAKKLMSNPNYVLALKFIKEHDLASFPEGRYDIKGEDVYMEISDVAMIAAEHSRLEAHDSIIEIHAPISGAESYGIRDRRKCHQPVASDEEGKDVTYYEDTIERVMTAKPGQTVTFSPLQAHASRIGDGRLKKAIIKVRVK